MSFLIAVPSDAPAKKAAGSWALNKQATNSQQAKIERAIEEVDTANKPIEATKETPKEIEAPAEEVDPAIYVPEALDDKITTPEPSEEKTSEPQSQAPNEEPDLATEETKIESGDILAKPEPIEEILAGEPEVEQPLRPQVDLDPQLRSDLETQFQTMRKLLETEDAFSAKLGEQYLSYGLLLKRAGRLDEAREKFIDALHIEKINNGVYSIDQRPILRALYDTNFLVGETTALEDNLKRIIWLESKHPDIRDDYTFDLVVKTGNHYIDLFLYKPMASDQAVAYLQKANKYLKYAVKRYDNKPLADRMLPYGEIALVNHLQSKIEIKFDHRPSSFDKSRQIALRDFDQLNNENYMAQSFSRGETYLKLYLRKAKNENNLEQVISALTGLGDINLLFHRKFAAGQYYELAWLEAQKLPVDHPVIKGFEQPIELPAFNYAYPRRDANDTANSLFVNMSINVDKTGRVGKVAALSEEDKASPHYYRARRAAKRLVFRPALERGKMVSTNQYSHDVRVLVRKRRDD